MVMTASIDEMDQIARQGIWPTPIKHESLRGSAWMSDAMLPKFSSVGKPSF